MNPHNLDVENLDFSIYECNEFNPFEDEKTPTPSSVPHSNLSQPNPTNKRPRVSIRTATSIDPRQSQISRTKIGSSASSMSPSIYNQQFLRKGLAGMVASLGLPLTFGEDPTFIHFMHKYAQLVYHRIPKTTSRNNVIKCYKNKK